MEQKDEMKLEVLFEKHRKELDSLKAETKDVHDEKCDDLFFLRYVLEFKPKAGADAVRFALNWKKDVKNAFILSQAQNMADAMEMPAEEGKTKITVAAQHKGLKDGGILKIIRPGLIDMTPMLDMNSHERMVSFHIMSSEAEFQKLDKLSRETGRLIQMVVVNDFHQKVSMPPKKVTSTYSEASKITSKLHPHLVQCTVFCNAPKWFRMMMKAGKHMVPKDTMQNIAICKKRGTIESCPFVSKYCNVDELPTFLGGKCECEGGCIPGLPNHMEEPRTLTQKELEQLKAEKEEGDQQEAENWEKFKAEFNK